MRLSTLSAAASIPLMLATAALACDGAPATCGSILSAYPVYTPEGAPVGAVVARARRGPSLERSRFTGQPVTVAFDNPGRRPNAIDSGFTLMPLPRAKPFRTQAVYPRGY